MRSIFKAACVVAFELAAVHSGAQAATNSATTRVKIASPELRENGCSETTKAVKVAIPEAEKLDRSYPGVLGGIEAVENHANNGHRFGNFRLVDHGTALVFDMWAKGAGNRLNSPFSHGSVCIGAAGATEAVDIFAHYKN